MAQLVGDPWFCAAVASRAGVRAHFIHQFSAGLATLGVLASCAVQRCLAPREVWGGGAGGAKGRQRGSQSGEGWTIHYTHIFTFPWG